MAILGGSPLGLIGSKSRPETSGRSSFPFDGASIGVSRYNQAGDGFTTFVPGEKTGTKKDDNEGVNEDVYGKGPKNAASISIFSSRERPNRFTPWPKMSRDAAHKDSSPGVENTPLENSKLHRDDLYDTSILNILRQLKGTRAELKASHFAYLKNLGVYPNNRLIIGRRFESSNASVTNIIRKGHVPLAVMISWVPQEQDFFTIGFGEEWEAAEVDFTAVLNELGNDFVKSSGLGDKAGGGLGVIPLPGFTETIQRIVLTKLGIMNEGSASYIPAGEPNLIKEAKRRKTIGYSTAGSGLKCSFSVKMTCEWEQKFISGLDPTVVWLDIIQQCLRFGTSNSVSYGLSGGFEAKIQGYVNNPMLMIYDLIQAISNGLKEIKSQIKKLFDKAIAAVGPKPEVPKEQQDKEEASAGETMKEDLRNKMKELFTVIEKGATTLLKRIVSKYKVRIEGILHALVGSPSGPWHVTIGNPMRPVFSSGDMVLSDMVQLTFGNTLAFNDLPSTIRAEFTLAPARNLGLQEIFARFNSGHIRSVLPFPNAAEKETFAKALGIVEKGVVARGDGKNEDAAEASAKSVDEKVAQYYGGGDGAASPYAGEQKEWTYREENTKLASGKGTQDKNSNSSISNSQADTTTTTTTAAPSTTTTTTANPNALNKKDGPMHGPENKPDVNSDANGPVYKGSFNFISSPPQSQSPFGQNPAGSVLT